MKNITTYTGNLIEAFSLATKFAVIFKDTALRTGHIILALYLIERSVLNMFFEKKFKDYCIYDMLTILFTEKETFREIFGVKEAKKYFEGISDNDDIELKEDIKKFLGSVCEEEINFLLKLDYINYSLCYSDNLSYAIKNASKNNDNVVSEESLLYIILLNKKSSGYKILYNVLNFSSNQHYDEKATDKFIKTDLFKSFKTFNNEKNILPRELQKFCSILNDKFTKGDEIDILGRDKELEDVFRTLGKKTKSNAILLGEAGVGKTAIVEALTQKIVNGDCPSRFENYIVISLDISNMISNTQYRGQFEEKIMLLKNFIKKYNNVIIFIDEVHQVMGAGSTVESNNDLANALKPLLAREGIHVIAATTPDYYEKYISCDKAFDRRFKSIWIKEIKVKKLKYILSKKIRKLEEFHNVKISNEIIDLAILYALYFKSNLNNPDKTIDIIDEAMVNAEFKSNYIVTEDDVKDLYSEQFELYENMSLEEKERTAYHEAAHYISYAFSDNLKEMFNIECVSIIGNKNTAGANILSYKDINYTFNYQSFEAYIIFLLAGKCAQDLYSNKKIKDEGASSDYMEANKYIVNMLTSTMSDKDTLYLVTSQKEFYTENIKDNIFELAKQKLDHFEQLTIRFLASHEKELEKVKQYLLEKGIVSGEELERLLYTK